jgi:hypothetical protein
MSMTRNFWRSVSWPVLMVGLSAPLFLNCGSMPKVPGAPDLPGVPGACNLDTSSAEAIGKFDFAGEFKLDATASAKLKNGITAAVELKAFADAIDADLKTACGGLATDLGKPGEYKSGEEACKAALSAMGEVKAKIGASAKLALDIEPPKCGVEMTAVADCAAKCDATVTPGSAKVECEPGKLQGECSAKCKGSCEMSAAASCTGTCQGSCDATFSGTCGGKCDGKCDGKVMDAKANGQCAGKCEGKCEAQAHGSCGGKCGGSCQITGEAECKGTCSGGCSVEMKAPKCTGEVTPPKMSAECKAHCDASVSAKAQCTPARVALKIEGAADAKAAAQYKAALEKNLPLVLKIAVGMGDRAAKMAANVKVVVEGVQGSVEGAVKASPMIGAKLTACVAAPFKGAFDAAASVKANVNVSVDVKASATASGSASGKAG